MLNEQLVLLLPAAVYSLCAGSAPFAQCCKELPLSYSFVGVTEASEKVCANSPWFSFGF